MPYPLKIGLGIGLGIGVPILLVLFAVAYLLAQPLHARRRRRQQRRRRALAQGLPPPPTTVTNDTEKGDTPSRGGGGGGRGGRLRRDSFGRVDTNVGPPSEDGFEEGGAWESAAGGHHDAGTQWRPAGAAGIHGVGVGGTNVAAALAAWARSPGQPFPFAFGGFGGGHGHGGMAGADRPDSPKEMDGRSGSRLRGRFGFLGGSGGGGAAELPSDGVDVIREEGTRGKVRVAAEEVELPTPDTPRAREGSSRMAGHGGTAAGVAGRRDGDIDAGVQPGRTGHSGRGYRSGVGR
jgi:hypothetical protein